MTGTPNLEGRRAGGYRRRVRAIVVAAAMGVMLPASLAVASPPAASPPAQATEASGTAATASARLPQASRAPAGAPAAGIPQVSPTPRSMQPLPGPFALPATVRLLVGPHTDPSALSALTSVLRGAGVQDVERASAGSSGTPDGPALDIWVGGPSEGNAGSAAVLRQFGVAGPGGLPAGGYVLVAGRARGRPDVVLSGVDATGTFYAVQTFRQLLTRRGPDTFVAGVRVRDWPSFAIRGGMESFYGDPWPQADALHQIEFLGEHKMNALLYTPGGDARVASGQWRSPYPPDQLAQFAQLVQAANASHVDFMYRIDPEAQLDPQAGICHSDPGDLQALLGRYEQLWSIGIHTISVGWDDAGGQFVCAADTQMFGADPSPLAAAQAYVINYLYANFVLTHPGARLITVPAEYSGDGPSVYRTQFAQLIPDAVQIFWTGPAVISPTITRSDLDQASQAFGGRKLLIFDNYPVNDYATTQQHLAPLTGRDPALAGAAAGVMANEMLEEEPSLIPLFTVADFAWNASRYDPRRSEAAAIRELGGPGAAALAAYAANSVDSPLDTGSESPVQPLIAAFLTAYTSGSPLSGPAAALTAALRRAQQAPAIIDAKVPDASFVSESAPWLDKLGDQAGADLAAVQALLAQTRGDRAAVAAGQAQMDALVTAAAGIPQVVAPGVYEQLSDFAQTETGRFLSPDPTIVAPAAGRQLLAAAMANTISFTVTGLAPGQLDAQVTAVAPAGWQSTVTPSQISLRSGNRTVQATIQLHVTPPAGAAGTTGDVGVSVAVDGQGTVTAQAEASVAALPAASYPSLVLGARPSGYWRLDDAGATEADASGNGNSGHDVGPVVHGQPGALAGSGDTAVQLDGGYVDVPNSPTVALSGPFTIEAWVKTTVTGQQQGIIEKYNTPSPDGFGLRIDADGRLDAFVSSSTASQLVQGATVVTPDVWHLVVATGDGASLKIYLDGFEDASLATTLLPQPGQLDLRLGARGDDTNDRLLGDLDEVAIYPSALSLGQIQAQYLAGAYGSASR
jgi:beta-N-acetylglucosaminidase-like protein/concanavalin A-like lectin/glucanase superfamily protein/glycosyl hydrolase family 20/hyaluronidase-like protein